MPTNCDLLIDNARLVTMNPARTIYTNGAVAIDGTDIVAVGRSPEVRGAHHGRRVIDAGGALVHPGYVDTHVHCSLLTSRGAFPDSLDWKRGMEFYTAWWNALSEEDEYVSALHSFIEMLRNGTTSVMETGTAMNPDVIAAAMTDAGIRGQVADSWLWDIESYPGASGMTVRPPDLKRSLKALGGQLKRNKDPKSLVRGHVAVYGMGTCSDELIRAAKETADKGGTTFSQHQSFAKGDAAADDKRLGRHPLVHLSEIGALGPNSLFTHMNVLREDEIERVVESGMAITWCLSSSMIWGVGGTSHGQHDALHKRGVTVALGSDSGNSALRFDLGEQAVLSVLTARDKRVKRDALGPEDALEMLTIKGAKAIGLDPMIGSLEVGKRADIVMRSRHVPEAHPGLDEIQSLILTQRSKSVDTVIVNGAIVVRNGASTLLDEEAVYARVRASARAMMDRVGLDAPPAWPRVD